MSTSDELWQRYRFKQDEKAREQIILEQLNLVKYLAGRLAIKLPSGVTQEDLEGYGVIGLIEAVDKFNPEKGNSFKTYAYHRIRGSMLDEIRKLYWLPRSLWQKLQKMNSVREKLAKEHGEPVIDMDLAKAMGTTLSEVHKLSKHYNYLSTASLDEVLYSSEGEPLRVGDLVEDPEVTNPLDIVEQEDGRRQVVEAIESLPEKDCLVLALYYQEGLTLKEIGQVLEVSESRVCQLHSRAMKRLRERLAGNDAGYS